MPYTDEQKRFYNRKPVAQTIYNTVTFTNPIAGTKRILASGPNGPYGNMSFNDDGVMETFQAVSATVPNVSTQDPMSTNLGSIVLARIASRVSQYVDLIVGNASVLSDRVITARIRVYTNPVATPIYDVTLYVGQDGLSMDEDNVSLKLQYENPAKIQYPPFYGIEEYTGLAYG